MSESSLGATIRVWRDRLTPADFGLPTARARRAIGLRREELAELAGVSVDYIVRLEQGRATTPSAQIVRSLSRALQLTTEERDHLYRLAGLQPPPGGLVPERIPPGMQRVLTRLGDTPVAVFSADWRLIWWNRNWAALVGDPSALAPAERSLVKSRFPTDSAYGHIAQWPILIEDRETSDKAIVADLRRASIRYPADTALADLISSEIAGNRRFAELWQAGEVHGHREDRKTIQHPSVGNIILDCDVLNDSDSDLKIVIYTARPGTEDETLLRLTAVQGVRPPWMSYSLRRATRG